METIDRQKAKDLLKNANNILIAPSAPVDGDSIGSALSLMSTLRKMGKEVVVVVTEQIPDYLKFLPLVNNIKDNLALSSDFVISVNTQGTEVDHLKYEVEQDKINIIITPKNGRFTSHDIGFSSGAADFDLIVTVDTGDLVQLGKLYEQNRGLFESIPLLNIDHHASNSRFGTYNMLDFNVAATTQMITPMIQELEQEFNQEFIDEDVATLLLVGIITDTGSFQHSNTTPEAFEVAADLLERGARQQEIIKQIFKTKSLATLKLWGRVLEKIHYEAADKLVFSTITLKDLEETGADPSDSGGIIDELMSNAPDAEVVLLLKEKEPGFVSGSLRAPGELADVSEIAGLMGGGGHKKAAGFRIRDKSMEEAAQIARDTISKYMRAKQGGHQEQVIQGPTKLFPNLIAKPQTSIPKPSAGGEDLLLEDFKKRNNLTPEEERIREKSKHFFQDADGQEKDEPTVEDVLSQLSKD